MPGRYASIAELMDADERGDLDDSTLDDDLWCLLVERISTPQDANRYARPVRIYYASRYLQWEVGNGGFAQAAYNIPQWFELAAEGYVELGLPDFAGLIREAMAHLPTSFDAEDIGDLFEQFSGSELAMLDNRLGDVEWEADDQRLRYLRAHRQAFRDVK